MKKDFKKKQATADRLNETIHGLAHALYDIKALDAVTLRECSASQLSKDKIGRPCK